MSKPERERDWSSLKRCLKGTKPKQERELGLKMARFQLSRFDQVAAVGVLVTSVWFLGSLQVSMPHLLVLVPFGRAGGSYLLLLFWFPCVQEVFFCHFYFLCVSCSGKRGRESNLTVTVSSIAPPKLCFGHLRAGFLVPWNSSYLDLVELILIYVWIFKASILILLMTPRPFIRLKTIQSRCYFILF